MSEHIEQKADRYLASGSVKVLFLNQVRGEFEVVGSSTYQLTGPNWTCTCPARVLECAHIVACKKITAFTTVDLTGDDENSKWLEDLLSS